MDPQPVLQFDVAYPEHLSRWKIFLKWLFVIPNLIVVTLLLFVVEVVSIVAWFAILITGNYPEGLFNFTVGTLRWYANVIAYTYLQRDEYPPFSMQPGLYPVTLTLDYPQNLSRWKIFLKWLFIIPHWIVLYLLNFALEVVLFLAWFAILFTGRFPRGMFDFVVGVERWQLRVVSYILLLTDAYPPFSLGGPAGLGGTSTAYSGAL